MKVTKAKAFEATNINRYSVVVSIGVVSRKTMVHKGRYNMTRTTTYRSGVYFIMTPSISPK